MYSKKQLRNLIDRSLHEKGWTANKLAQELGIPPSNLNRALVQEGYNLTLPQFAHLVKLLELTPEQTFFILTGKKQKEAKLQSIQKSIIKILEE